VLVLVLCPSCQFKRKVSDEIAVRFLQCVRACVRPWCVCVCVCVCVYVCTYVCACGASGVCGWLPWLLCRLMLMT